MCVCVCLSVSVYIDDCVFCVPEFVSGLVGKNDGNACCHQNQRVHRKKELNQVQSRAFYSRTGRRREVVYSMRMKQLKKTGAHCTTTYVKTRLKIW